MPTKTLYTWDTKSILRQLDQAIARLTILNAAGLDVPLWDVTHARETLLNALIQDVPAETLPAGEPVARAKGEVA